MPAHQGGYPETPVADPHNVHSADLDPDCGAPWPVCPEDHGQGLTTRAGTATCPRCGRSWPADDVTPCPWLATTLIGDTTGVTALVCASHAAHPSAGDLTSGESPT